jgi:hypothetical protein
VFRLPAIALSCIATTGVRPNGNIGVEAMSVLCLSGAAAEELFCGKIEDDADRIDIAMAREALARRYDALEIGFQLARARDSAEALVRAEWAQQRIRLIAEALFRHGSLSGTEILELSRQ